MIDMKENRIQQGGAEKLSGLPVDTTVLFSDHKDIYRRRIEKRQRKLLAKLGMLAPFFGSGEKILHVTFGFSPASFVEQLLTGAFLHPLKRSLFVFTNRRILHIPTSRWLSYRCSISQIMYVDCRQLRIKGFNADCQIQKRAGREVPLHQPKRQKESQDAAPKRVARRQTKPFARKNSSVPKMHKAAYKRLLHLPELLAKIQN